MLTTANISKVPGVGVSGPARCIAYVGDSNTGNVVGYSVAWNATMAAAGRQQGGTMLKVIASKARPDIGRNQ